MAEQDEPIGEWIPDPTAESGFRWQRTGEAPRTFAHDDGTRYTRISADEFPNNDDVDSTTIVDDGAPD